MTVDADYMAYRQLPYQRLNTLVGLDTQGLVDAFIAVEVRHLPRGADPEDFAQDIREKMWGGALAKVEAQANGDWVRLGQIIALTIHRLTLNWCRTHLRNNRRVQQALPALEALSERVTEDGDDLRHAVRLAHEFAESFPDFMLRVADQEGTNWSPRNNCPPEVDAYLRRVSL